MNLHRTVVAATGCVFAAISCTAALAATPFGLFVGAAGGQADVRMERSLTSTPTDVSEHDTGWKVMAGIRPLQLVGIELEYLDFGNPSYRSGTFPVTTGAVRAKAETLFGVLYAPLPVPFLDLYGKVGPARLQTSVHGNIGGIFCPSNYPQCGVFSNSQTNTELAYGAGLQLKFGRAAVRAEYERINASTGDPSLASVGLTWTF
jgi:Outer membrane protein beta-barrel domain